MPAPINISAATAIDLGVLPATISQDVRDAGVNYTVWYKYTTQLGERNLGIWGHGDLVNPYAPRTRIYIGPAGAPVLYEGFSSFQTNKPIQITVAELTTYYFEFLKNTNTGSAILDISALTGPNSAYPNGSYFITDDIDGTKYPAAIISSVDATVLKLIPNFASGENGDTLLNGRILHVDNNLNTVRLYNQDLTFDQTISTITAQASIRANHALNLFYILEGNKIYTVSSTGVLIHIDTLASSPGFLAGAATNNTGTKLYYSEQSTSEPIKVRDLVGFTDLSDLAAGAAGYVPIDIIVLQDDTILVTYNGITDSFIRRYDDTGTILNTYNLGATYSGLGPPRIGTSLADPLTFIAWWRTAAGEPHIAEIQVSDGTVLSDVGKAEYTGGIYGGAATLAPTARFGNSSSCPIIVYRSETPPPSTGIIIISKVTVPTAHSQEFSFDATGLAPAEFTLIHGQSQQYNDVPVGSGYGILETVPSEWTVGYAVNNGSPIDNISVAEGETVIVVVTNTLTPNNASGIYKIVPGKRQDTLWVSFDPEATRDVKIPNPKIKLPYIG